MSKGTSPEPVTELDLLAYADGHLDRDPGRCREVETYLAERPQEAERVAAFRAQNEALRLAGESRLCEPVPERLAALVNSGPSRSVRVAPKVAAMAALLVMAAAGGWLVGSDGARSPTERDAFAIDAVNDSRARSGRVAPGSEAAPGGVSDPTATARRSALDQASGTAGLGPEGLAAGEMTRSGTAPLDWLEQRIAVEIKAPDLAAEGFRLLESRRVLVEGEPTLRMIYRRSGGEQVSLYLRPRWSEDEPAVRRFEESGATILHWFEGPLAVALVAEGVPGDEATLMVDHVKEAVEDSTLSPSRPETLPLDSLTQPPVMQEVHQNGSDTDPQL